MHFRELQSLELDDDNVCRKHTNIHIIKPIKWFRHFTFILIWTIAQWSQSIVVLYDIYIILTYITSRICIVGFGLILRDFTRWLLLFSSSLHSRLVNGAQLLPDVRACCETYQYDKQVCSSGSGEMIVVRSLNSIVFAYWLLLSYQFN